MTEHIVERTIRNGTVRFYGRSFRVAPVQRSVPEGVTNPEAYKSDPPYDGSLDGLRARFHNYAYHLTDSIFLHSFGEDWPGPNCDSDGYFRWERWDAVSPVLSKHKRTVA